MTTTLADRDWVRGLALKIVGPDHRQDLAAASMDVVERLVDDFIDSQTRDPALLSIGELEATARTLAALAPVAAAPVPATAVAEVHRQLDVHLRGRSVSKPCGLDLAWRNARVASAWAALEAATVADTSSVKDKFASIVGKALRAAAAPSSTNEAGEAG